VSQRHVSVVIAVLDEASNIEEIYERFRRDLLALPDTRSEFIWVLEGDRRNGGNPQAALTT
jgi:hypothetical protein